MTPITVIRTIDAPIDIVFKTVADISQFSEAIPRIVSFEILSETTTGVGTRFRETRLMQGKEAITELEVTEFVENERVRMVADSHGTAWDTVFAFHQSAGQVELKLTMESKPYKLLPRIMNVLIRGMIQKAVENDMDAVKTYCEEKEK